MYISLNIYALCKFKALNYGHTVQNTSTLEYHRFLALVCCVVIQNKFVLQFLSSYCFTKEQIGYTNQMCIIRV
jgi:hypothetical protein